MSEQTPEPEIVEYGPYRVIGMCYVGKNENGEVPALWGGPTGFGARMNEVVPPGDASAPHPAFGVMRCWPGATDGSFEYIAAASASEDAPVPEGMVEARIPAATYVAFAVPSLERLMEAFGAIGPWMAAHPEWEGYCTPDHCECATHPSFELYPPSFCDDGALFVYVPVRARD